MLETHFTLELIKLPTTIWDNDDYDKAWFLIKSLKNHIANSFNFAMLVLVTCNLTLFQHIVLRKYSALWLRKSAMTFLVIADHVKLCFSSKKFKRVTRKLV